MNRESIMFNAEIDGCKKLKRVIDEMPSAPLSIAPGQMESMPIVRCLKILRDEGVVGYVNNRGNGKASSITSNEVMSDFEPLSIRVITIGDFRGNPNVYGGRFVIGEGHSRIIGIIKGLEEGTIRVSQLNVPCAIQLVPEKSFIRTYQKNNSGRTHTQNDKLTNPDLVFGNALQEYLLALDDKRLVEDIDRGIRSTMMSIILLALHKESKGHKYRNFAEVYELRREASRLSNKTKHEFKLRLTEDANARLTEALKYWQTYIDCIRELSATSGVKGIFRIFNRKGWFGAIVCDKLFSEESLFYKSPKMFAQACHRNATSMDHYTNSLTGPRSTRLQLLTDASRVLRGEIVPKR